MDHTRSNQTWQSRALLHPGSRFRWERTAIVGGLILNADPPPPLKLPGFCNPNGQDQSANVHEHFHQETVFSTGFLVIKNTWNRILKNSRKDPDKGEKKVMRQYCVIYLMWPTRWRMKVFRKIEELHSHSPTRKSFISPKQHKSTDPSFKPLFTQRNKVNSDD